MNRFTLCEKESVAYEIQKLISRRPRLRYAIRRFAVSVASRQAPPPELNMAMLAALRFVSTQHGLLIDNGIGRSSRDHHNNHARSMRSACFHGRPAPALL